MSEKRFTIKKSGKGLFYSDGDYSIDNTIQFVIETVEFKLNQLNDENEELRKENEQLKQQIQQLQHWNKCLAEKRHQELSYRHYTDSKSEKELKELLDQKWFNCSDR